MPKAALIATGIRDDGVREILGLAIGDSESFAAWEDFFMGLKGRSLKGVLGIISDRHACPVEEARKPFQGVSWQRCQVHLLRNLLGRTPSRDRAEAAAHAKRIFQAPNLGEACRPLAAFVTRFETIAPKAALCLEEGFEDVVSARGLPEAPREVPPVAAYLEHAGGLERGDPPTGAGDPDLPQHRIGPPSRRGSLGRAARDVGRSV